MRNETKRDNDPSRGIPRSTPYKDARGKWYVKDYRGIISRRRDLEVLG